MLFKIIFVRYDTDKSGFLEKEEVISVMVDLIHRFHNQNNLLFPEIDIENEELNTYAAELCGSFFEFVDIESG